MRRHINVFVNGERAGRRRRSAPATGSTCFPAISGGCTMTELLVGTKKGLFVLEGEPGGAVRGDRARVRRRAGRVRDARPAHRAACSPSVTSPVLRPEDLLRRRPGRRVGAGRGRRAARGRRRGARADLGDRRRRGRRRALRRRRPRRAVREPRRRRDAGRSTARCGSTRRGRSWQPGGGGLCLHSIVDRGPASRTGSRSAISAAGVWLTDDGGATWRQRQRGHRARATCPTSTPEDEIALCVHRPAPRADAARAACSCSSTAASTAPTTPARRWTDIGAGLPSDFGFPLASTPPTPTAPT